MKLPLLACITFSVLLSACSVTKYTLPPNVYRSMISPKSISSDNDTIRSLNRTFVKNKKLLILSVAYDQYENVGVPSVSQAMMESMKELKDKMHDSGFFSDVQFTTTSHFKIATVEELNELSRHFGADYVLIVNSAYNFYKYSTTWGNFIAWFPIINFMIPFNRFTGNIFVEGTLLSLNGAILFTESVSHQLSENTNVLYSKEHFLRMSKELHRRSYNNMAVALIKDLGGSKQK